MLEVTVQGIPQLTARLEEIPGKITAAITQVFQEQGSQMVEQMKARCPVDTGFLRDSIALTESSAEQMTIEAGAEYAPYVEFGTYKMEAEPFFYPVVQEFNATVMARMIASQMHL